MGIGDATDGLDVARQLRGDFVGLVIVGPRDADVDRCRLAEIQHLVDDVGWLEEELQLGEALGQFAA